MANAMLPGVVLVLPKPFVMPRLAKQWDEGKTHEATKYVLGDNAIVDRIRGDKNYLHKITDTKKAQRALMQQSFFVNKQVADAEARDKQLAGFASLKHEMVDIKHEMVNIKHEMVKVNTTLTDGFEKMQMAIDSLRMAIDSLRIALMSQKNETNP